MQSEFNNENKRPRIIVRKNDRNVIRPSLFKRKEENSMIKRRPCFPGNRPWDIYPWIAEVRDGDLL